MAKSVHVSCILMGIGLVPQHLLFMKNLLIYLLLLLSLAMASCGGDDKDEPNYLEKQLTGTWVCFISNEYSETILFNSNHNGEFIGRMNHQWVTNEHFTWELDGSTLKMRFSGNNEYYYIISIVNNVLIMKDSESDYEIRYSRLN